MGYTFNFPKNKRAAEATLDAQLAKCAEELDEVLTARYELNDSETIDELMDLACAVENAIRKFDKNYRQGGYDHCIFKGKQRGDWA